MGKNNNRSGGRISYQFKLVIFFLFLIVTLLYSFGINISVSTFKQKKPLLVKSTLNGKTFGSIMNNDIDNILAALNGKLTTPAEYEKAVFHLLDAKPGLLAQNVGLPDPVIYPSRVATTLDKYYKQVLERVWGKKLAQSDKLADCMRALFDAGTDPLTLTIKACRIRNIPIVASYRMNSTDFYQGQLILYDFGRKNENLSFEGLYNARKYNLDPAYPKVYAHRMKIFSDVAFRYDIDGIEFDFMRNPNFIISDPEKNHKIITQMLRETRLMLDFVAKKKGRKPLILGVRVPPSLLKKGIKSELSCEEAGLDLKLWVKEGLINYICPSFEWGKNPHSIPNTAEFVKLVNGTNIGVYPTIFPLSQWQENENQVIKPIGINDKDEILRYQKDILNTALNYYKNGAHGISTYNWVPHQQPGMVRKGIRDNWGLGSLKMQMFLHPLLKKPSSLQSILKNILKPHEQQFIL